MSGHFRIFAMLLSGGLVISSAAEAFFPFPSPLTGKDPANLALDKVENLRKGNLRHSFILSV